MKHIRSAISLSDFINQNKLIARIVILFCDLVFFTTRKIFKLSSYNSDNLIILSYHRLGDTIFTIPAIREIQKHFKLRITIVCFPESVPIYKLALEDVNFCVLQPGDLILNKRIINRKFRKTFKALRPKIIFDLIGGMSTASLLFNSRAKEIFGTSKIQFRSIYDHFVEIREKPQLVDIYLDVISLICEISDRAAIKTFVKSVNPEGKILIHPLAGWKEKEWGLKKFAELAKRLKKEFDVSFILPPAQFSFDVIDEIINDGIGFHQTNSVEELIKNIKECSLFIGNDSGPVNIANFLGRPSFTIYGATNPDYTSTFQDHQIYTQKKLSCSAFQYEKYCIIGGGQFICPGIQCMNLLSVEEVYDKVISLAREYCIIKN
jgi:heptosyltransferase-2